MYEQDKDVATMVKGELQSLSEVDALTNGDGDLPTDV